MHPVIQDWQFAWAYGSERQMQQKWMWNWSSTHEGDQLQMHQQKQAQNVISSNGGFHTSVVIATVVTQKA